VCDATDLIRRRKTFFTRIRSLAIVFSRKIVACTRRFIYTRRRREEGASVVRFSFKSRKNYIEKYP